MTAATLRLRPAGPPGPGGLSRTSEMRGGCKLLVAGILVCCLLLTTWQGQDLPKWLQIASSSPVSHFISSSFVWCHLEHAEIPKVCWFNYLHSVGLVLTRTWKRQKEMPVSFFTQCWFFRDQTFQHYFCICNPSSNIWQHVWQLVHVCHGTRRGKTLACGNMFGVMGLMVLLKDTSMKRI